MSQSNSLLPRRPAFAVRHELRQAPGLPFAEHLPTDLIHRTAGRLGVSFRDRVYTPAVTLLTFLSQVLDPDHSCRQAVARLLAFRSARGLRPCSPDTGAYCKARGRLPEPLLRELTRDTGRRVAEQAPAAWRWKGRPVQVVDGTGLSMPDTPANQKAYPKSRKLPAGVGFPLLRLVVVFSLAAGTVLEAALGRRSGKGTGEQSLFRGLWEQFRPGDVLLADRLYGDFFTLARARQRGIDVVTRPAAGREPIRFHGRRADDLRLCWIKPPRPDWMGRREYDQLPRYLHLRAVRVLVRQPGFRTKRLALVTTLTDAAAVTGADLAELYRRRWQAELNLRALKQTLQMDVLRGKSPEMVRKEVWAHLLVYNLVRLVMAQAAAAAGVRADAVSFTGALQTLNAFLPEMRAVRTAADARVLWEVLLWAVGEHRVGHRPDRYEPRAVKRRPKNFPRLSQPREAARRRLRRGARRARRKR
jgi:Transposase DDE domain